MANRLGDISKQALSLIERDKIKNPSTAILNKLAIEFGVTIDYLVSGIKGNKDNFLHSKMALLESISLCREKMSCIGPTGNKSALTYKKTENLLELFDVICHCLHFDVQDNYDLYTDNLNKLTRFIDKIANLIEEEIIESGLEIIVDKTFWRLGKVLRGFAVRMDEQGERNLSPEELANITVIVEDFMEKFGGGEDLLQKVLEIDLREGKFCLTYRGFVNVPEDHWNDFVKRIILEWEIIMQKMKKSRG